jgi:hypothetical protein
MNNNLRREIKIKALKQYCLEVVYGIPYKWIDNAFDKMIDEKQDYPTERIKTLIDFVIDETERLSQQKNKEER